MAKIHIDIEYGYLISDVIKILSGSSKESPITIDFGNRKRNNRFTVDSDSVVENVLNIGLGKIKDDDIKIIFGHRRED